MAPDPWRLYESMLTSRLFEEAVSRLWHDGAISGEMHLGTGEEGIVAGVVDHLTDGDAMALDHRGTPPMLMRGIDPVSLLREFMGHPAGLCGGKGGHMHLFSPEQFIASSGIVGASGPTAAGFALAGTLLRPGSVAVAFFGEGAVNQGMLMESFNLAVAWKLPVLFVCKDNQWAITTESPSVTGGSVTERARSFGMRVAEVEGWNVEDVWQAAGSAIGDARAGRGPAFIHASCIHTEGHFLGDHLVRIARRPAGEMAGMTGPLLKSMASAGGAGVAGRASSLVSLLGLIGRSFKERTGNSRDPIARTRGALRADSDRLGEIEDRVARNVSDVVAQALEGWEGEGR
jgi:pyruvate dehydrogenase E1 component alpha subunit